MKDTIRIHQRASVFSVLVLPAIALLLVHVAACQAQEMSLRHYTVRDGLPSNHIRCLFQDSRGFVWAGTSEGLALFAGSSIRAFGMSEGLLATSVVDIAEDGSHDGSLWIATLNGLYHFDGRRFRRIPARGQPREFDVSSVMTDHRSRLWCFANDTLYHLQGDSLVAADPPVVRSGVGQMIESGDSLIWMAHAKGTTVFNERTSEARTVFAGRSYNHGVRRMARMPDGSLWTYRLGDDEVRGTLERYVGVRCVDRWEVRGTGRVDFLLARGDRELFLGGFNGVRRIAPVADSLTNRLFLTSARGLQENYLRAGMIDREGNLWVGGNGRGVSRLMRWNVVRVPMDSIESGHRRSVAAADGVDHLWVAAPAGLWEVCRSGDGNMNRTLHPMSPGPVSVWVDARGALWVVNASGDVCEYRLEHRGDEPSNLRAQRRLVMGKELPAAFPVTFLISRAHELVYSLGNLGLIVFPLDASQRSVRLYGAPEGVPINYVQEVIEDHRGRLWCGTYMDGVRMVDPAAGQTASAVSDPCRGRLPEQPVRSIMEDHRGRIWIGMRSTGLVLLSGDSIRTWTMASGLPGNTVWSMTEDSAGWIWAGTTSGAARIDPDEMTHVVREPALTGANVFDCGTFHNGLIWFLSSEGLTILDPAEEQGSGSAAGVYITDVSLNGNPVPLHDGVEYPSDMNTLTAAFVTPSYFDEQGNAYRFRLLPREEAWHGPTTQGSVTYALLPPGTYTLEVRGTNARGIESPSAASFSFTITAPVWSRWWFLSGAGIAVLLILAWSVRAHEMRRIRERMRAIDHQQGLDRERLRISQDMHDEIGSTLTEITLLSELSRQAGTPPGIQAGYLTAIAEKSRAVVTSISEIIWAVNPHFNQAEDLFAYIRQYATQFCETAGLLCSINVPDGEGKFLLSSEQRRNVFLVVKESLRNIVKHAASSSVEITILLSGVEMTMTIADDGQGFAPEPAGGFGTGLESMRKRVADIGGVLVIESRSGAGTTLTISLKLGIAEPQEKP